MKDSTKIFETQAGLIFEIVFPLNEQSFGVGLHLRMRGQVIVSFVKVV